MFQTAFSLPTDIHTLPLSYIVKRPSLRGQHYICQTRGTDFAPKYNKPRSSQTPSIWSGEGVVVSVRALTVWGGGSEQLIEWCKFKGILRLTREPCRWRFLFLHLISNRCSHCKSDSSETENFVPDRHQIKLHFSK